MSLAKANHYLSKLANGLFRAADDESEFVLRLKWSLIGLNSE